MKLFPKILLFILLVGVSAFPQETPFSFNFSDSPSAVSAATSENPASNSISAMLVQGDTVWLGTSRGLSRSTDKGLTWRNYYGDPEFGTENISAIAWDNTAVSSGWPLLIRWLEQDKPFQKGAV